MRVAERRAGAEGAAGRVGLAGLMVSDGVAGAGRVGCWGAGRAREIGGIETHLTSFSAGALLDAKGRSTSTFAPISSGDGTSSSSIMTRAAIAGRSAYYSYSAPPWRS